MFKVLDKELMKYIESVEETTYAEDLTKFIITFKEPHLFWEVSSHQFNHSFNLKGKPLLEFPFSVDESELFMNALANQVSLLIKGKTLALLETEEVQVSTESKLYNSRAYTAEEVQDKFLTEVEHAVSYWSNSNPEMELDERLQGLTYSIMSLIDGSHMELPGFKLIPSIHPADKQQALDMGLDYYEEVDIAGTLHEVIFQERDVKGK